MQSSLQRGVLIADVVASRSKEDVRASLNAKLRLATIAHLQEKLIQLPYAVTAGDEFQAVLSSLKHIPKVILDLRRRLLPFRLRVGVGIGAVDGRMRRPVNRITGQAFENAREAILEVKSSRKYPTLTVFRSNVEMFDAPVNLIYGLHDTLLLQTSQKQWETIATYLIKDRVDYTAKALDINRSTASRNLRRGYFWQMEDTAATVAKFIEESFPDDCTK